MTKNLKPNPHELSADNPAISEPTPPPKKVGRPKGYPKTGGRVKGVKNWTHPEIRDALLSKSEAIETIADIVAGRPMLCGTERTSAETGAGVPVWRYPTLSHRIKALEILLAKVVPDLRATELSGPDGKALLPDPVVADTRQVARAVLSLLSTGANAGDQDGDSNAAADSDPPPPDTADAC